ncbi:hypothetical protein SAMN05216390_11726 [Lachnospiraceae bacterium KH1T2]|nr:hypothetical protein SAMN05216390_11726 [Lachnospiraceae bacterium KH1T2]
MRRNMWVRVAFMSMPVLVLLVFGGCVLQNNDSMVSVSTESADCSVVSSEYSSESADVEASSTDVASNKSYDKTDTLYETIRSGRRTHSEDDDLTESKGYGTNSDQEEWSSDKADSLMNDPDDYDTPEDYADDAWGDDFDDWDEAYEYWEDNY